MLIFWIISGICGGIALAALFVWLNNSLLKTTRYKLNLPVTENLKIVLLSDLHAKRFGRKNAKLIEKIANIEPDFVAVTGDIIHKYRVRDVNVALELVSSLSQIAPVLFVSGNHEMRSREYRIFRKQLAEAGAEILDNRTVEICGLTVTGLNCASLKNDTVFKIAPSEGGLLLAHMPQFIDKYAAAGYKAVFCGHAHGGQWRIPFTDIGFYSPGQGILPKLTSGVHDRNGLKMIISRGLGNSRCPLRLFNCPEIVVVDIEKE